MGFQIYPVSDLHALSLDCRELTLFTEMGIYKEYMYANRLPIFLPVPAVFATQIPFVFFFHKRICFELNLDVP